MIIKRGTLLKAKLADLQRLAKWLGIDIQDLSQRQVAHLLVRKINKDEHLFDTC